MMVDVITQPKKQRLKGRTGPDTGGGVPDRLDPPTPPGLPEVLREDAVRNLIVLRVHQLGLYLRDASVAIGMRKTYLSVFLTRGTPKELPAPVRAKLAALLQVSEDALVSREGEAVTAQMAVPFDVPLFREMDTIDPEAATAWAPRPPSYAGIGGLFAVSITTGCVRTRPGDTVYASTVRAPRIGDLAICLRRKKIVALGVLASTTEDTIYIRGIGAGNSYQELPSDKHDLCKVVSITTA